jgi:hypothetical protein
MLGKLRFRSRKFPVLICLTSKWLPQESDPEWYGISTSLFLLQNMDSENFTTFINHTDSFKNKHIGTTFC